MTKNGRPEGVFLATSDETWLEDVQEIIFARARRATQEMRMAASKSGVANLNMNEIDAEIRNARSKREL